MGLVDDLAALVDLMEEIGAEFMLVGGVALEALGVPRSTLDIGVQVRLTEPPGSFSTDFHGWFIAERSSDEVFEQDVLILEGRQTGVPVELFLTEHWYTGQALDRRQTVDSGMLGGALPVPQPEDFVLLNAAYRASPSRSEAKSTQDLLDIEGVLEERGDDLDRSYVEENARKLGVWEDLEGRIG